MDAKLGIVYISGLLVLLAGAVWFVGRQVLISRKIESRFSSLQNKLKQEKGTAEEYYELASLYLDKKLFVQAVNLLQKSLKSSEADLPAENLALIYNGLGFAYSAQEQYDIAIRQYKEALKHNPQYVVALNNLGYAYEKKQLLAPALEAYEQVLVIDPDNATAKRRVESLKKRYIPAN